MDKPAVGYERRSSPVLRIGQRVILEGVMNHPSNLKGDCVITSPVVAIYECGEFETENTIYYPTNR